MLIRRLCLLLVLLASAWLTGCASRTYTYRYVRARTATMVGDYAVAPPKAPDRVKMAIAAGNSIVGTPYVYGGGHGRGSHRGFDCSGMTSYVLQSAGVLRSPMPSRGFRRYGASGEGKWISVYARKGHVFLVVAGLRLDTGYHGHGEGPRWTMRSRPARGYVIRHPRGL